jgi:large subunit ribosomal protein L18
MSEGPRYRVAFRRRREGKTDYRRRLRLLKSHRARAVVRLSGRRVLVSVTAFDPAGDRVVAAAESRELPRFGFPESGLASTPASYLTGYLAGLRAKEAGTTEAVLDAGTRRPIPGGRLLGALRGLLDAGIDVPHSDEGFPSAERLSGRHLHSPLSEPIESYRDRLVTERPRRAAEGDRPSGTAPTRRGTAPGATP